MVCWRTPPRDYAAVRWSQPQFRAIFSARIRHSPGSAFSPLARPATRTDVSSTTVSFPSGDFSALDTFWGYNSANAYVRGL